jgi:4-hydroxythreonine-4-phosphate dehydrogenase
VLVGSLDVAEYYARRLRLKILFREITEVPDRFSNGAVHVHSLPGNAVPVITPGVCSPDGGRFAGAAIELAAGLCLNGDLDGMVTAPVSKTAMHTAGYRFPGQTEMLASLSGGSTPLMILAAGRFRVSLATIHVPVRNVSRMITQDRLKKVLEIFLSSLRRDFAISRPSVAVLGLNPHAGEEGHIGTEEQEVIRPALAAGRRKGWDVHGPFAADGFFGTHRYEDFDGIVAMYHDQGLIPLKMKGFECGVNITAGLPLVRTSPDHGTAFDIAGQGIADAGSMIEAIRLAVTIVENRRRRRAK